RPADLDGQVLKTSTSRIYDFGAHGVSSVVRPGETLRVTIGGDASEDSRLDRHWEQARPIIDDRRGVVALGTLQTLLVACDDQAGERLARALERVGVLADHRDVLLERVLRPGVAARARDRRRVAQQEQKARVGPALADPLGDEDVRRRLVDEVALPARVDLA